MDKDKVGFVDLFEISLKAVGNFFVSAGLTNTSLVGVMSIESICGILECCKSFVVFGIRWFGSLVPRYCVMLIMCTLFSWPHKDADGMDRCPDPRNAEIALVNEALGRTRKCVPEPYHIAEREQARKSRKQKSRIDLSLVGLTKVLRC
jgi:hypothetical protein